MLDELRSPLDLRALTEDELSALADEIREVLIRVVSSQGGHLASNLGAVELTIALHCVFEAPKDKILFDVGHQAYVHKLLTGRYRQFSTLRQKDGISGFPRIQESKYDAFGTGHASTAISAALGMARAYHMQGEKRHVVAVVGDGALTGGMCSLHIDGHAHGPSQAVTTCQIYMRKFKDGATITIEPWRSAAFPVIKDLVVNRSSYDQILQAGGFISVRTNSVPDGNAIPIPKADADESMDAAACVGCGACAATCKNGSAMLFVAARVSSLAKLPQGRVEGARRAKAMVAKMDELGFGNCTNTGACQAECPKSISIAHIARLNREFLSAKFED